MHYSIAREKANPSFELKRWKYWEREKDVTIDNVTIFARKWTKEACHMRSFYSFHVLFDFPTPNPAPGRRFTELRL